MSEDMIELGKRATACKSWRWIPGMLHGAVVGDELKFFYRVGDLTLHLDDERIPELTDPATLGCLLALVREAWGDPHASVGSAGWDDGEEGWVVVACSPTSKWSLCNCKTEAEALVAALEAAP